MSVPTRWFFLGFVAVLLGCRLLASGDVSLQTRLYVYREADFASLRFVGATRLGPGPAELLQAPATAAFGRDSLVLGRSLVEWSAGRPPPEFSLIFTPVIALRPGKAAALLSSVPVQYLERLPNGNLEVREIPANSPDAPHIRLTFALKGWPAPMSAFGLRCDFNVATVAKRDNIPGVVLDVGKPRLAALSESCDLALVPDVWSAVSLRSPNGSSFSMLLLLRVVPARETGPFSSAAMLDRFVTYYYLDPQPARIAEAIRALNTPGFLRDRQQVMVGFFAEVFAANPQDIAVWRKAVAEESGAAAEVLRRALKLSEPGAVLKQDLPTIEDNDLHWGAYFASGNPAYIRWLVDQLQGLYLWPSGGSGGAFWAAATAEWSLARNLAEHPELRPTLEAIRGRAPPRTQHLIDEILTKKPEAIRAEIRGLADRSGREIDVQVSGGGFGDPPVSSPGSGR